MRCALRSAESLLITAKRRNNKSTTKQLKGEGWNKTTRENAHNKVVRTHTHVHTHPPGPLHSTQAPPFSHSRASRHFGAPQPRPALRDVTQMAGHPRGMQETLRSTPNSSSRLPLVRTLG
ncbi:hypothetical protein TcCL_Unassigned06061, partial [Trypanosoma cruzi]